MKKFLSNFKSSAAELKSIRCLTTAGILTALYIVLDVFSFKPLPNIKINFDFIAVAMVGILFGPIPAAMTSVAGDFLGCILSGLVPNIFLSFTAMLSGLLYGTLLYKKSGMRLVIFSIIARVIDSAVICLIFQTAILIKFNMMSPTQKAMDIRYGIISTELVFFIPLMIFLLPAVQKLYEKNFRHKTRL